MPAIIGAGAAGAGTELSLSEQGFERTFKCCIRDGLSTQGFFSLCGAEGRPAAGTDSNVNIFDLAALTFEPDRTIQDRQCHSLRTHDAFEAGGLSLFGKRQVKADE